MISGLEKAVNIVLAAAAAALAVSVVHREFAPPVKNTAQREVPVEIKNWREAEKVGVRYGKAATAVTILTLSDMECPYCARFNAVSDSVLRERDDVSALFVHLPLRGHRFAIPAARGAECADREGRFREYADAVFANQDSLGQRSWTAFAQDARLRDTAAFVSCMAEKAMPARILGGEAFASKIGAGGTPTVILNGWKIPIPQTRDELFRMIDSVKIAGAK